MTTTVEIYPWVQLFEHVLLFFLLAQAIVKKYVVPKVFFEDASPELVGRFFTAIDTFLEKVYPLLQEKVSKVGRPPLDQAFQFRFWIWNKFFGEENLAKSLRKFNSNPELQELLCCPVRVYYQATATRFLKRIGEETFRKIHVSLVIECIKLGLVKVKNLIIDGFPVMSYLGTIKCLKNPSLKTEKVKEVFGCLDISKVVETLRKADMKGHLLADCLKAYIFHILWNMPSQSKCIKMIKEKERLNDALGFLRRCPGVATYRGFTREFRALEKFKEIQKEILALLSSVPALKKKIGSLNGLENFEKLRGLMSNSLPSKDAGAKLNYCASKKLTFWGRGGKIITDASSEIALLLGIQTETKINSREHTEFLTLLKESYGDHLKTKNMVGDCEFDHETYRRATKEVLNAKLIQPEFDHTVGRRRFAPLWFLKRIVVERCIGRLQLDFKIEEPRVLGEEAVGAHVQLSGICQVLQALASYKLGRKDKIRSITFIRG